MRKQYNGSPDSHPFLLVKREKCSAGSSKIGWCLWWWVLKWTPVSELVCSFSFRKFDVNNEPRPGRLIVDNVDEILKKIEVDRHISSTDIATRLNIDHKTVLNHLYKTGYQKKLDTWIPHELTVKNVMDRVSICESLLKKNKIEPFLKRMITGNEKWITYDNNMRKTSWLKPGEASQTVSKPVLTPKKVMLSAWWDWKRIVHHELLEPGQTINSTLYCRKKNKNWQSLTWKLWCIHRIARTLSRPTTIYFGLWRRCKVGFNRGLWKSLGSVFRPEMSKVLQWRNYDFTRKVKKGHWSKRHIYHWLVFEIYKKLLFLLPVLCIIAIF